MADTAINSLTRKVDDLHTVVENIDDKVNNLKDQVERGENSVSLFVTTTGGKLQHIDDKVSKVHTILSGPDGMSGVLFKMSSLVNDIIPEGKLRMAAVEAAIEDNKKCISENKKRQDTRNGIYLTALLTLIVGFLLFVLTTHVSLR